MRSLRSVLSVTLVLALSAAVLVYHSAHSQSAEAAARGPALTGVYPNWFTTIGKSQSEVDAKVRSLYDTIFTENGPDDVRIYQPVGSDMANILSTHEDDTRTEGNSWGMMIALQMNDRDRFNKIWKFAKTYMQCPNVNTDCGGLYDNLFIWHVDDDAPYRNFKLPDGTDEYTPAPDGENYFATALLMAGQRWGDGEGIFDYTAEAGRILAAMKDTSSLKNGELSIVNPDNKLVRFIPTWVEGAGSLVDTSYQLPGFYEYWARLDPTVANRPFWNEAAGAARRYWANVIGKAGNRGNGIFPDCTKQDGSALDSYSCASGYKYGSDGWRTIQNVVMDSYWWSGEDSDGNAPLAEEAGWVEQFLAFARDKRTAIAGEYKLDGTAVSDWSGGAGQAVMTATGAMITTDPGTRNDFLNLAWDTAPTTGEWRYYSNALHMLGLLHLSGNYRAWFGSAASTSGSTPPASSPTPAAEATATTEPSAGPTTPASATPTESVTAPAPTLTAGPASSATPGPTPATDPTATGAPSTVYGDAFAAGWAGEGWNGTLNAGSRSPVFGGSGRAIAMTPRKAWAAVGVTSTTGARSTAGLTAIKLRVNGGGTTVTRLQIMINPRADGSGEWSPRVRIDAPAGRWTEFTVPLQQLGNPVALGSIAIQDATGSRQPKFSIDDLRLL